MGLQIFGGINKDCGKKKQRGTNVRRSKSGKTSEEKALALQFTIFKAFDGAASYQVFVSVLFLVHNNGKNTSS